MYNNLKTTYFRLIVCISLFIISAIGQIVEAQIPGRLDISFGGIQSGANNRINSISIQPNGKIIIGGAFSSYDGTWLAGFFTRLNIDGSWDYNFFVPFGGTTGDISSTLIQPDGKVIATGFFTTTQTVYYNRILRVNSNGSSDTTFNVGTGPNNQVLCSSLQSDGKIIIGGYFTDFNGTAKNYFARINSNGSLDNGFNIGTGADNIVQTTAIQADQKIIIGGTFTTINSTSRNSIARINSDGSLDNGFNVGTGANAAVYAIAIQPDGKILIGGEFSLYNGTLRNFMARLNTDGSIDTGFNPSFNDGVRSISLQSDGKIIVGGEFTTCNNILRNRLARLNADGTLDTGFNHQITGANNSIFATAVQADGKILIGGDFTTYDDSTRSYIARIYGGTTVAVEQYESLSSNISIYPNPAKDNITLITPSPGLLQIFTIDGKLLTAHNSNGDFTLNTTAYSPGLYIIHFIDKESGKRSLSKFLKE